MSSVVISGDTSGAITLSAPAVAGTNTITLPAATGTAVVTGTTPTLNGITFPATQVPSADANTLDDYEEGTFTPTAYGQTSAGTTTYTQQHGFYTKIGRQVTVIIFINWTAMTGTGILRVGSLPFTSSNLGQGYSVGAVLTDGLNWTSGTSIVSIQFDNTNFFQFENIGDDLSSSAQLCVNEATGIRLTSTYFV